MKKIKDKIIQNSIKDRDWRERVKKRQRNEEWADLSFKIAVQILRHLRLNNISQKSVAEKLNCSPQYLSKLLKGKENLTLETIWKLQKVLGLTLIKITETKKEEERLIFFGIDLKEIPIELSQKDVYIQAKQQISITTDSNYYIAV